MASSASVRPSGRPPRAGLGVGAPAERHTGIRQPTAQARVVVQLTVVDGDPPPSPETMGWPLVTSSTTASGVSSATRARHPSTAAGVRAAVHQGGRHVRDDPVELLRRVALPGSKSPVMPHIGSVHPSGHDRPGPGGRARASAPGSIITRSSALEPDLSRFPRHCLTHRRTPALLQGRPAGTPGRGCTIARGRGAGWSGGTDGRRLRILLVIKGLGHGGAERLLMETVAAGDHDAFTTRSPTCWHPPTVWPMHRRGRHAGARAGGDTERRCPWLARLRSLVRAGDFDVVHFHLPYTAALGRLAVGTLGRRERPAVVYTEHSLWNKAAVVTKGINRLGVARDESLIVVSQAAHDALPDSLRAGRG